MSRFAPRPCGNAVALAVDRVVRLVLERREHVRVVGDQVGVDRIDVAPGDQAQRRVARRGHAVVVAGAHQRDHLVGGVADLHVDLAAGLLLEVRHPVDGRVGRPVLDVAGPGDEVDLALALAHLREGLAVAIAAAAAAIVVVVVAAACRRQSGQRERDDREHDPPFELVSFHSPSSFDSCESGMTYACSSCQPTRTRRPRCSSACCEDISRFCRTTCSSPPRSRSTTKRVIAPM